MTRRRVLSTSAIIVLGLAVLPGSAVSQQKSMKDQLVGTWMLTSWEQEGGQTGPKFQRFGANPKGFTIFDASGRVYAMFARPDLAKIASNNPSTPTPEEAKAIVSGAIAYYGTYTVDETAKVITMKLESSSFANQTASDQKRTVTSLTPTELKMHNTTVLSGGQIYYVYRRAN